MKKFNSLYKEHQKRSEELFEEKVLNDFNSIYSCLLEKFGVPAFDNLNEKMKGVFLKELNTFWSDETGILDSGKKFLQNKSLSLTEHSTPSQKTNYLKKKMGPVISETIRQTGLKWKLYDVINEVYKQTGAKELNQVLTPESLVAVIKESLSTSLSEMLKEINFELKENSNPQEKKNLNEEIKPNILTPEQKTAAILINKCAAELGIEVKGFKKPNGMIEVRIGDRLGQFLADITSMGHIITHTGFGKNNYAPEEFEDYYSDICEDIKNNAVNQY